jgi:hypothetical protein
MATFMALNIDVAALKTRLLKITQRSFMSPRRKPPSTWLYVLNRRPISRQLSFLLIERHCTFVI